MNHLEHGKVHQNKAKANKGKIKNKQNSHSSTI